MPKKILIIDDEPEICKFVVDFLNDAGYSASSAFNGPAGLDKIEKEQPSLVLLDIGMPGMDGIEVMREIHQKWPALPVVILTAQKDPDTVKKMIQYGACEYLTKPIHLETLLDQFVKDMIGLPR
ncbi:MAG TPA: response regulator [Candidatus Omnitrophota bacterium]|nr:response regulator [Candidatus Omnitrophota bacterium]HPS36601.1 response regulator [Candidatus Omnitrophota bacterium]